MCVSFYFIASHKLDDAQIDVGVKCILRPQFYALRIKLGSFIQSTEFQAYTCQIVVCKSVIWVYLNELTIYLLSFLKAFTVVVQTA